MAVYGQPAVLLENDVTDRIGIRTLVLSQMWQPVYSRVTISALDSEKPQTPVVPEGVILVGEQTRPIGGAWRTTWTFEGVNGDGKSVTFKDRKNSIDYQFEPGLAQVPVTLWRGLSGNDDGALQQLLKDYQGTIDPESGLIIWNPTLADSGNGNSGGSGKSNSGLTGSSNSNDQNAKTNPLFGLQDFFRLEGTYRYRYCEKELPPDLNEGAGLVTSDIPGEPPSSSDARNWLKVPPQWRRRGTVYDITELFWLSGPGGWPQPIYGSGGNKNFKPSK